MTATWEYYGELNDDLDSFALISSEARSDFVTTFEVALEEAYVRGYDEGLEEGRADGIREALQHVNLGVVDAASDFDEFDFESDIPDIPDDADYGDADAMYLEALGERVLLLEHLMQTFMTGRTVVADKGFSTR